MPDGWSPGNDFYPSSWKTDGALHGLDGLSAGWRALTDGGWPSWADAFPIDWTGAILPEAGSGGL